MFYLLYIYLGQSLHVAFTQCILGMYLFQGTDSLWRWLTSKGHPIMEICVYRILLKWHLYIESDPRNFGMNLVQTEADNGTMNMTNGTEILFVTRCHNAVLLILISRYISKYWSPNIIGIHGECNIVKRVNFVNYDGNRTPLFPTQSM